MSTFRSLRFFFVQSISSASGVKDGAMMISRKMGFNRAATSALISQFVATIPPKMLTVPRRRDSYA